MPVQRYKPEQIATILRQIGVARGGAATNRCQRAGGGNQAVDGGAGSGFCPVI